MWQKKLDAKDSKDKHCIEFMAEGWPQSLFANPGAYTFEFTPDHTGLHASKGGWFDLTCPPLSCGFTVEEAQPCKMAARWEAELGEDELPLVRVGDPQPPAIVLQLLDEQDRPVSWGSSPAGSLIVDSDCCTAKSFL